ncbi:MAG: ParB N-terminal domain-containing protein [Nanopusillaceae archaeon]
MEKIFEIVEIEKIKPYENNPRKHEKSIPILIESIKKFGYISPIIVDENYEIISGHGRYYAIKELVGKLDLSQFDENIRRNLELINKGLVEVIKIIGMDEKKKMEYRISDNKLVEYAEWDYYKLLDEMKKLDFKVLGFTDEEIEKIKDKYYESALSNIEKIKFVKPHEVSEVDLLLNSDNNNYKETERKLDAEKELMDILGLTEKKRALEEEKEMIEKSKEVICPYCKNILLIKYNKKTDKIDIYV